jgi:hypothetical protein
MDSLTNARNTFTIEEINKIEKNLAEKSYILQNLRLGMLARINLDKIKLVSIVPKVNFPASFKMSSRKRINIFVIFRRINRILIFGYNLRFSLKTDGL